MTSHATQLSKFRESADASVAQCKRMERMILEIDSASDARLDHLNDHFDRMFAAIDSAQAGLKVGP